MAIIIKADTETCAVISAYLLGNDLTNLCEFHEEEGVEILTVRCGKQEKKYTLPLRLGELLDQINKYKNSESPEDNYIYFKGGCSLDLQQGIFTNKNNEKKALTEKEVEILNFLNKNNDNIIPRTELLEAVWGYADNVETHTLETHIYRLRQKIEHDPSNPEILITKDSGYSVSMA